MIPGDSEEVIGHPCIEIQKTLNKAFYDILKKATEGKSQKNMIWVIA